MRRAAVAPRAILLLAAVGMASWAAHAADAAWVEIDYRELVDERQLSHSGEPVGTLLSKLGGRAAPPAGERPEDQLTHSLLDPLVEPYAFVLSDLLDRLEPLGERPRIDMGSLWRAGEPQPAWVELLRARRYVVESDGAGALRVCLPWAGDPSTAGQADSAGAAREAFTAAWPVLRHLFAAERRRLTTQGVAPSLRVTVHPYIHARERSAFLLGTRPHRLEVQHTRSDGRRPPLDLDGLQGFLDAGLQLEGARLEPDGTLRLLGSRVASPPRLLGRKLTLADFAVAYRAVFHGGLAEPYMSLDRGFSPQTSIVNYGGRLRDTALGWVSLLCDIRFKTFSLGIDIVTGVDLRETLRSDVTGFRTHLERFAYDPAAADVTGQQTRLWFYPDRVDLTLSPESDVLVLRRVRMSAASERVQGESMTAAPAEDPPWTLATVEAINADYAALGAHFPELGDLDQVVRLLSLFTWLRQAGAAGLVLPDLDELLAVELPGLYTPRTFPQLLAFNALPAADSADPVHVFDRADVGAALDRLVPRGGRPLPARRRFERASQALDPGDAQHRALREEFSRLDPARLDDGTLDLLAFRAERLRMHQLVLATLAPDRAADLVERQRAGEQLRIFSVGIGGLDLGMGQVLSRASSRSLGLGLSRPHGDGEGTSRAPRPASARNEVREAWRIEPSRRTSGVRTPDHGAGRSPDASDRVAVRRGDDGKPSEVWTLAGAAAPDVRSRRLRLGADGRAESVERVEDSRLLRYAIVGQGGTFRARLDAIVAPPPPPPGPVPLVAGLARMSLGAAGDDASSESPAVRVRLGAASDGTPRQFEAELPREALQRLVLGRQVDMQPRQSMPLSPLPPALGAVEALMLDLGPAQRARPWEAAAVAVPGEEDPVRVARALNHWSRVGEVTGPPAVVGVDAERSAARWAAAPPGGPAMLWLPADGFPGRAATLRETLERAWQSGPVVDELPAAVDEDLIVLISHDAPSRMTARLLQLAGDPALAGKLVAVWPLGGPLRTDLPAALLADGGLAGLGLAPSSALAERTAAATLATFSAALSSPLNVGRRIEQVDGPFLWHF